MGFKGSKYSPLKKSDYTQGWKSSAKIFGRNGPAKLKSWAGPGRSFPILFLFLFLKDFLKKIWTLLLTRFKLSIFLSKKCRNIGEIFAEYWQKTARPGPQKFCPARFVKPEIYNPDYTIWFLLFPSFFHSFLNI